MIITPSAEEYETGDWVYEGRRETDNITVRWKEKGT